MNKTDTAIRKAVNAFVKTFHSESDEDRDYAVALISALSRGAEERVYHISQDIIRNSY